MWYNLPKNLWRYLVMVTCPFCNKQSTPHWQKVNVYKCSSCGLLFRHPVLTEEELNNLYANSWSDYDNNKRDTGGTNLRLARIYAAKLAKSLGLKDFSGLKLLEFGAGQGNMLQACIELGATVTAIEPFGYKLLKSKGYRVYKNIAGLPPDEKFDGIITIDVVEHLDRPWETISQIKNHLVPSGWMYVCTLNSNGINARLSGSKWREVLKESHFIFFTARFFDRMFKYCNASRHHRISWFVNYKKNPVRQLVQYILQMLYLDGALRYIIYFD